MSDFEFLTPEVLTEICGPPEVTTTAKNWHGHVPFARWLILQTQPQSFVELGVFRGDSYLAFCESVKRFSTNTKCVGIDTWAGDEQAGALADDVFIKLSAFHDHRYGSFSKLEKSLFKEAVADFEDSAIDLLHVDGLHTYEAVRADYQTWLPKMSSRGVMLFHDTQEREDDFGVHRLWSELADKYPHFEFEHSHGLGVLAVGANLPDAIRWLTSQSPEEIQKTKRAFEWLAADGAAHVALRSPHAGSYGFDESARDPMELQKRALEFDALEKNAELEWQLDALRTSTSWRITAPLRKVMDAVRRRK